LDPIAHPPEDGHVSDLVIGLVVGYLAGTVSLLVTLALTRHAGAAELVERAAESVTANGIPAP